MKSIFCHKYSAFTLVELLVVMAIIGVMMGISVTALYSFRESSKLNTATSGFTSSSKTLMNLAVNSVYKGSEVSQAVGNLDQTCASLNSNYAPEAIGFVIQDSKVVQIGCIESTTTSKSFCCKVNTSENFDNSRWMDSSVNFVGSSTCNGVLFEYATGKIYSFNSSNLGSISALNQQCVITLNSKSIPRSKQVTFSPTTNEIEITK